MPTQDLRLAPKFMGDRRLVQGRLRWRGRCPLSAGGEVQLCALAETQWAAPPDAADDPSAAFRQALAVGELEDEMPVLSGGGPLQARELTPSGVDTYAWPDPAAAAAFQAAARGPVWAVAWLGGPLVAPLALVVPGGLLRTPQLVHLVSGTPAEPLNV